jgi:hypothetical protein
MRLRLLTVLLVSSVLLPGATAVVRIDAWTTTGDRIEKIWVVLSPLNRPEKYKANGRDVKLKVPTGEYLLEVEAVGFLTTRQVFPAYQRVAYRSVALPVAPLHGSMQSSLAGTVRNYEADRRKLRVRLMALYGSELRESPVDAKGQFHFPAEPGAYILMIVADLEKGIVILDSIPLRILGHETVDIDLKGKQGTTIPVL